MPRWRPRVILPPSPLDSVLAGTQSTEPADNYAQRLVKYIPAELVAAHGVIWTFFFGTWVHGAPITRAQTLTGWIVFGIELVLAAFWVGWATRDKKSEPVAWHQVTFSALAFTGWCIYLGHPFSRTFPSVWDQGPAAGVMVLLTLIIPVADRWWTARS